MASPSYTCDPLILKQLNKRARYDLVGSHVILVRCSLRVDVEELTQDVRFEQRGRRQVGSKGVDNRAAAVSVSAAGGSRATHFPQPINRMWQVFSPPPTAEP